MLLVYTHKITPRFTYVMKHLFTTILGIEVSFSTKVEDFIKHSGPKITYAQKPLQNEFFIASHSLLFELGVEKQDITVEFKEGIPYFFPTSDRSDFPYDIFAATFYLISRYEEYLPHIKDAHGRFSPRDSLAYQHNFLRLPVVDQWAYIILSLLQERFPDLNYKHRSYAMQPIIDVTTSHAYVNKGLLRSIGGVAKDLGSLQFTTLFNRIKAWLDPKKDPYDNFEYFIQLHNELEISALFFFQFASYSTYDKNISPTNTSFRYLIKLVADYAKIGLSASYASFLYPEVLLVEKNELAEVIHRPVNKVRMRFNRVDLPDTYRNLVATGFQEDYTMGYTHEVGFRASTCTPFYLYDLGLEAKQPIKVHAFAIHDYALLKLNTQNDMVQVLDQLHKSVKAVNGRFVLVFSNELLGGEHAVNWKNLYKNILNKYYS